MTIRRAPAERGAALLVVMVSIAVLTALSVDLAYQSRVSLQIAANARDELRASYAARSGVTLSRLVLSFQQQLDMTGQAMSQALGQAGLAPGQRIQIWRIIPVGSTLATTLFGSPSEAEKAEKPRPAGREAQFDTVIEDEGRKINVQLDGWPSSSKTLGPQVQSLYQLVCDPRWDWLFEQEDAHGIRTSREDLLVHLRDWVYAGPSSALAASSTGVSCGTIFSQPPFQDGFGDKNQPYDQSEDRYRVKNARMDSLDEMYLVAGVSDAFMAAFGNALTVYLPRDAKMNLNSIDRDDLLRFAGLIALPKVQARLLDPKFAEELQKAVMVGTFGGGFTLAPADFAKLVTALGVTVNTDLVSQNGAFADQSTVFRIRANGTAGGVKSTIDAVVWPDKPQPNAPPGATRIVHWREE